MPFTEYKCRYCGRSAYAFVGEENRLRCAGLVDGCYNASRRTDVFEAGWEKLPPSPRVIHQTECFLSEPVLDSMDSNIELDRILTREKSHDRELKLTLEARKHL